MLNNFVVNEISEKEMDNIIDYYNNGIIKTVAVILDDIEITRLLKKYMFKDIILLDTVQIESLKDNDIIIVNFKDGYFLISKNIINDKFLMNL